METKVYRIRIGDWSHDGHNVSQEFQVKITADDLSAEAIEDSLNLFQSKTGIDPQDILNDPEDVTLDEDMALALYENGFRFKVINQGEPAFFIQSNFANKFPLPADAVVDYQNNPEPAWGYQFNDIDLMMNVIGFGLTNFSYEVLPPAEDLIGGYDAAINSHGYGLY